MQRQFESTTLDRFIFETTKEHADATGQFATLSTSGPRQPARLGPREPRRTGRDAGRNGEMNVQGEFVQKLDIYANETFKRALEHPGVCAAILSEEDEDATLTPERFHSGRYVFCMDPLDGSSNIDVNATIGTIFGIFRRRSPEGETATDADILQAGNELVAAGYVVYGSGTVMVLAVDGQVNGFTLDPVVGEFFLSHPDIQLTPHAKTYSVNEAYAYAWDARLRTYVDGLKQAARAGVRYIGSLVADFHRNPSRAVSSCTRRPHQPRASSACSTRPFRSLTSPRPRAAPHPMATDASWMWSRTRCMRGPRCSSAT